MPEKDRIIRAAGDVYDWLKASEFKNSEIEKIAEWLVKHSALDSNLVKFDDELSLPHLN